MRVVHFVIALLCFIPGAALGDLITFEGFADSTVLTDQYQSIGATFQGAEILTAEYSLNEFEFPPHSGVNVATDYGGPMVISFASPIVAFSGYFTYTVPLSLQGEDSIGNPITNLVSNSLFSANTVSSFDPTLSNTPNEFIQVGDGTDTFSQVLIAGDPGGSSFVVDDITFALATPEPGSLTLVLAPMVLAFAWRMRREILGIFLGVLVCCVMPAQAQLISTSASPTTLDPNTPTNVTIIATFEEPPIPASVILQQLDDNGDIVNPNLGTLMMISPTSYYINYTVNMDEGTDQLQVSAGFADQVERNTSKLSLVAGCKADPKSSLSVCFGGNLTVFNDHIVKTKGVASLITNPMYQDAPALNQGIGYKAGDTMVANIRFVLNPVPAAPIQNVTVTGTLMDCPVGPTKFEINNVTLADQASVAVTKIIADAPLKAALIQYCDTMMVDWTYTVNNNTTNIGTSSNRLHVTLGKPLNSKIYLTDLFLATSAPGGTDNQSAVDNTWSLYSTGGKNPGPQDVTGWDLRKLAYYPTGTHFSDCAVDESALLLSPTGAGKCGSFAALLQGSLNANGINVGGIVQITPRVGTGFLVNNWAFGANGPPYRIVFTANVPSFDMVPPPDPKNKTVFGDLTNMPGVAGQNSATPSQKAFGDHAIIKFKTTYYDPSYGLTYTGKNKAAAEQDFINQAVAGYIGNQTAVTPAARAFVAVKPGALPNNINFSR